MACALFIIKFVLIVCCTFLWRLSFALISANFLCFIRNSIHSMIDFD